MAKELTKILLAMRLYLPFVMGFFLAVSGHSCLKDTCENVFTYQRFDPVYVRPEILRQKVSGGAVKVLRQTGKIYVYSDYLLINEPDE